MLELRPNCEWCDRDLPPESQDACICSYECTYCVTCVETVLKNVCPTCGGNLQPRPIRPQKSLREGKKLGLHYHPASRERVHSPYSLDQVLDHCNAIAPIKPWDR